MPHDRAFKIIAVSCTAFTTSITSMGLLSFIIIPDRAHLGTEEADPVTQVVLELNFDQCASVPPIMIKDGLLLVIVLNKRLVLMSLRLWVNPST